MSDQIKGAYIVFDKDYEEEDAKKILEAIQMIKGVIAVETNIVDSSDWMNRRRIENEIHMELIDVVQKRDK